MKHNCWRSSVSDNKYFTGLLLTISLVLTGCSGSEKTEPEDLPDYWIEQFDFALSVVETQLAREVLSDYRLTVDEYLEVRDQYQNCLRDSGFTVVFTSDGKMTNSFEMSEDIDAEMDAFDRAERQCNVTTDFPTVSALYHDMRFDPHGLGYYEVVADCLYSRGVTTSRVSAEEVEALTLAGSDLTTGEEWLECMRNPPD